MELLMDVAKALLMVLGTLFVVFLLLSIAFWLGALRFEKPPLFWLILFVLFTLMAYSSLTEEERKAHTLIEKARKGIPLECKGFLVENPQFKRVGEHVFVILPNGTAIHLRECNALD